MKIEFPDQGVFSRDWLEEHPERLQDLLAQCRGRYPLCKCREPGLPLYIARRTKLYLARLPNSGPKHDPRCPSYEPDRAFCGWSIYSTQALRESAEGHLSIKLGVALHIRSARLGTLPGASIGASSEARHPEALKLPGLLHLLWERSEFNRWRPGMLHRRHYRQLRKYVLETAETIHTRRQPLTRHLYVPEAFSPELALEIEARRQLSFRQLGQTRQGAPMRILTLGKLRSVSDSDSTPVLRLAHLPNEFAVNLAPELLAKLQQSTQFAWIDGRSIHPEFQLFLLLTMQRSTKAMWQADAIAGLVTSAEFIPLHSIEDALLCQRLVTEGRSFYKPMHYDAPAARFPNFILTDCDQSRGVPLEIITSDAADSAMRRLRVSNYEAEQSPHWTWELADGPAPPLMERTQI